MATKKKAKTWRSKVTGENLLKIFAEENEICVFDTETTGLKPLGGDTIIQISALKLKLDDFSEIDRLDMYINPGRPLPPKITEITGITDEFLSTHPLERDAFARIFEFFGTEPVIAAHNTRFDKSFIEQLYERNGKVFLPKRECDTLEMARDLIPKGEIENHKLGTLAHLYGIDEGLTFHNSMDDVIATSRLLRIFKSEYEDRFATLADTPLIVPKVISIKFWPGFRGFSRQYINTDSGTFYYDIRAKIWGGKDDNCYTIDEVDMETLKESAFKFAGVTTEQEFARFRG